MQVNAVNALEDASALQIDNSLSNINEADLVNVDGLGSEFMDLINKSATPFKQVLSHAMNAVDTITSNHRILNAAIQSDELPSASKALAIQNSVHSFSVTTQLFSKTVSTIVKDIDTLTRIQ